MTIYAKAPPDGSRIADLMLDILGQVKMQWDGDRFIVELPREPVAPYAPGPYPVVAVIRLQVPDAVDHHKVFGTLVEQLKFDDAETAACFGYLFALKWGERHGSQV